MSVISGVISIKDNATAVIRAVSKETKSFKSEVESTKQKMQETYYKKYEARIENSKAAKAMDTLKKKMDPLRKKLVTAVALKDAATDKVKTVATKLKQVGKTVAKPVVSIAVKGMNALKTAGQAIAKVGKVAAVGITAVAAAGGMVLGKLFEGSEDAARAQIEAETKLEAVLQNVVSIQERGPEAYKAAKDQLMGVASELQKVGVIGDEVTAAGFQQLATFQLSDTAITTLSGGMSDLLAQQKGLNATQEDSVTIANLIGKAMQGNVGALSRVGITFSDAQSQALKLADTEERAGILAEILQQNVGGVNQALAKTDQGKIQQMTNNFGDMKEEVGKVGLAMKAQLADVVSDNLPMIQRLGQTLMGSISKVAVKAMPLLDKAISTVGPLMEKGLGKIGDAAEKVIPYISGLFEGMESSGIMSQISGIGENLKSMGPPLMQFGSQLFSTLQSVGTSFIPVIESIVATVASTLPVILPVIETVFGTVGEILSAAAPAISGMVEGIGSVVSALAPVFQTIFDGIGEKVASVWTFVGERMGFIQGVFEFAGPLIADIFSTMWTVLSPIMDLLIGAFKLVFNVVQKVWPGIQKVIETVWGVLKPIFEGIGSAVEAIGGAFSWLGDKIGGLFGGGGGGGGSAGKNADGTNSWRGGPTWVGEEGPELVDFPHGTRVLPTKQSNAYAAGTKAGGQKGGAVQRIVKVTVAKLADQIVVREEADIDRIGEAVAHKIEQAADNMAPVPV